MRTFVRDLRGLAVHPLPASHRAWQHVRHQRLLDPEAATDTQHEPVCAAHQPTGGVVSAQTVFASNYYTAGTQYLTLPTCSRVGSTDTCMYGTYRLDLRDGEVVEEKSLTGSKPGGS
jgi:hypothetical protein